MWGHDRLYSLYSCQEMIFEAELLKFEFSNVLLSWVIEVLEDWAFEVVPFEARHWSSCDCKAQKIQRASWYAISTSRSICQSQYCGLVQAYLVAFATVQSACHVTGIYVQQANWQVFSRLRSPSCSRFQDNLASAGAARPVCVRTEFAVQTKCFRNLVVATQVSVNGVVVRSFYCISVNGVVVRSFYCKRNDNYTACKISHKGNHVKYSQNHKISSCGWLLLKSSSEAVRSWLFIAKPCALSYCVWRLCTWSSPSCHGLPSEMLAACMQAPAACQPI